MAATYGHVLTVLLLTSCVLQLSMTAQMQEVASELHNVSRRAAPISNRVGSASAPVVVDETESFEVKQVIDACASSPCQNGGVCTTDSQHPGTKFRCACKIGHVGSTCNEVLVTCNAMRCIRKGDCVSSPGGAICICDSGDKGRLCEVKMQTPGTWENVEAVVLNPSGHMLSAVFVFTVVMLVIIAIALCVHCCRAKAKCSALREGYKADIQKGLMPRDPPPDLLDVSNAMCCCGNSDILNKHGAGGDTKSGTKKRGSKAALLANDDLNKTSNSITQAYSRSLERPKDTTSTRHSRRPSGRVDDSRPARMHGNTHRLYSRSTQAYGSNSRTKSSSREPVYDEDAELQMEDPLEYESIKPIKPRSKYSSSRFYRSDNSGNNSSQSQRKTPHRAIHSPQKRTNSSSKRLETQHLTRNGTNTSQPTTRHLKETHTKSPRKVKSKKYLPYGENADHHHCTRRRCNDDHGQEYSSSSTEEEIYHRTASKQHQLRDRFANRNTNTNQSGIMTESDGRGGNGSVPGSECLYSPGEVPQGALSPDARSNASANNSVIAEHSGMLNRHTERYDDGNGQAIIERFAGINDAEFDISSDEFTPARIAGVNSSEDMLEEGMHGHHGAPLKYDEEHAIKQLVASSVDLNISTDEAGVGNEIFPADRSEYHGIISMRVTLEDTLDENVSAEICSITDQHEIADVDMPYTESCDFIHKTRPYQNGNVCLPGIPSISPSLGDSKSDASMQNEAEYDRKYVRSFVDKGKTLYYISGRQTDVDDNVDNVDVVADGRGSLIVVPKAVMGKEDEEEGKAGEEERETVLEVGQAVKFDTTEENV